MHNNRSLDDPVMNELDHALGRPTDVDIHTRNFFGVSIGGDQETEMLANPYWKLSRRFMGTAGFSVSNAGKEALRAYLAEHWTPPKKWSVTWNGFTETVEGSTRSKAKYNKWLEMDTFDILFGDFLRECSIKSA